MVISKNKSAAGKTVGAELCFNQKGAVSYEKKDTVSSLQRNRQVSPMQAYYKPETAAIFYNDPE